MRASAARLWNALGYHLYHLADYAAARAAYERAMRIDEAVYGLGHPNVAIRDNNLGRVMQALGDLAVARACLERDLRILEHTPPLKHPCIRTVRENVQWL